MESLNARLRKRLATICTANPYHAIPLYHKLVEWENENIIQKQDAHLAKTTLRGQYLQRDSVFSGLGMYAAIATPQDTVPLSAGVQGHRSDSLVSIGESESCYGATRTGGKKRCGNGKGQRGEPERPRRRRLQRRHGGRHARRGARGGERSAEGAQSGACKRAPRRKATIGVSIRNTIGRPVLAQCMKRRERTGAEEADGRGCI